MSSLSGCDGDILKRICELVVFSGLESLSYLIGVTTDALQFEQIKQSWFVIILLYGQAEGTDAYISFSSLNGLKSSCHWRSS